MSSGVSSPCGARVELRFEVVEGDLAHDRVDHVLDLAGEEGLAGLASGASARSFRKVSISPKTLAVSAGSGAWS
jgi:hypothetical protein